MSNNMDLGYEMFAISVSRLRTERVAHGSAFAEKLPKLQIFRIYLSFS